MLKCVYVQLDNNKYNSCLTSFIITVNITKRTVTTQSKLYYWGYEILILIIQN